ncbi:MAG: hypothetical protein F6K35_11680 [Okeania sp. SIO2H7]|nr:hypothetical protein [Okeania sp. SIO2H7]
MGILVNVQPPNNTPSTPLFFVFKGRYFLGQFSGIGPLFFSGREALLSAMPKYDSRVKAIWEIAVDLSRKDDETLGIKGSQS